MQFTVREAMLSDTDEIRDLIDKTLLESLKKGSLDPVEMMASANRCIDLWLEQPDRCFHAVAVKGRQIIGVVLVKEHWNLVSLFVKQGYQGMGIGKELITAALDSCRGKSRYNAIFLNAAQDSAVFYEKLGFVRGQTEREEIPGVIPMLMRY